MNLIGFFLTLLFPFFFILSSKGGQSLSYGIFLFFLLSLFNKNSRNYFKKNLDKHISFALIIFIVSPFLISIIDGGISTRGDLRYFLLYFLFFPFILFLNTEKRIFLFLKSLGLAAILSLIGAAHTFITTYNLWSNSLNERITFKQAIPDYANFLSLFLIFFFSFFCFYKNKNKKKNIIFKLLLIIIICLNIFILLVSRTKMAYVSVFFPLLYIIWKKNKKHLISFFIFCIIGFSLLPYTIKYKFLDLMNPQKDNSSYTRLIFWETAIASFKKSPIFGMNINDRIKFNFNYFLENNLLKKLNSYYSLDPSSPIRMIYTHNTYLNHLAFFGLGFLSVVYLMFIIIPIKLFKITFFKNNFKDNKFIALEIATKASFLAYLIQGMSEHSIDRKPMIFMFSIILFFINYLTFYKKNNNL